jgi:2-polyprenyl-3-methyl-5-hydroxy-6-metoxy-1,4-benzoquinol methylase
VLDIGCGTGALLETIARRSPGLRLAGIDLSPAQLAEARRRLPGITLIEADANRPPFIAGAFDVICSLNVLHHLTDPGVHLRTLASLCRPGASVFVVTFARTRTTATRIASRWLLWQRPGWRQVLSTASLRDMINAEPGLEIANHTEFAAGRFWYLQAWQLTVTTE